MFQPVASLTAGQFGWSEALVRWRLPDGTVRGPLDILPHWLGPVRIEGFTRFTLFQAARTLAANPNAKLSVNLTPAQLQLPETLRILSGMLPAVTDRLFIEVVEGRYRESAALARQLGLLREHCGGIFLDDVTAEDLARRIRFSAPLDGVKLDRSVACAALYEGNDDLRNAAREFVTSTSQRFGIVVAEGIEDLSACEELMALGASHVQGFGIAKPGAELRTAAGIVGAQPFGKSLAGNVAAAADLSTRTSN